MTDLALQVSDEQAERAVAELAQIVEVWAFKSDLRGKAAGLIAEVLADRAALLERCKRAEAQLADGAAGASSGVVPDGVEASYIRIVNIGDLGYVAGFPTLGDFTKYRDGVALCCAEAESGRLGDEPYVLALDWPVGRFTADEQRALLVALKASFKARLDDESRDAAAPASAGTEGGE